MVYQRAPVQGNKGFATNAKRQKVKLSFFFFPSGASVDLGQSSSFHNTVHGQRRAQISSLVHEGWEILIFGVLLYLV